MLNYFSFQKSLVCFWIFCTACLLCVFSSYSLETDTLNILSLLKAEKYSQAVVLMEQKIKKETDKHKKGYYALLINQVPANVKMKKNRHEYAFMAVKWAKNLSDQKKMSLWIEAGDGFFQFGNLKKADDCYKSALSYTKKEQPEFVYILHKRAWVSINENKWIQSARLLIQTLEQKKSQLRDIILSDIGKIWVESQYFKNKVPLSILEKSFQSVSRKEQKTVIEGIIQGIGRMQNQGINTVVSKLSGHQELSTRILDHFLSSKKNIIIPPCRLLRWMEQTSIRKVNREQTFSVLNSCAHKYLSSKRKSKFRKNQLKRIAKLYLKLERKGMERWPLILIYHNTGKRKKACNESLYQLVETMESPKKDKAGEEREQSVLLSLQVCRKARGNFALSVKAVNTVFSSSVVREQYKKQGGAFENALFDLLSLPIFQSAVRKDIQKAGKKWGKKDILPLLFLARVEEYDIEEIERFLDRFAREPLDSHYMEILITRGKDLPTEILQKWLAVSEIDSYRKLLPWFDKVLAGKLSDEQKATVIEKLLIYFPEEKKSRASAGMFLVLHYFKNNQEYKIFEHWDKMGDVFNKKKWAVKLFETSLYKEGMCDVLNNSKPLKQKNANRDLLIFIHQSCQMIKSRRNTDFAHRLKLPSELRSNSLAWDFVILNRVQKRTKWLEKRISRLEKETAKMIMSLKKSISNYQKRKWRSKEAASQVETLLKKQIGLFEGELTKLSKTSPYGNKYKELKNIVIQWR